MANLSDNILTNMDNKLLSGLLLVGFKKAFHLVDHDTLLDKLRIYGCFHFSMAWFCSYLSGRSQKTQFKGTYLKHFQSLQVDRKVVDLFSLLFTSMTCRQSYREFYDVNADDTTLLVRGPSITSVSTQLNEVARTVSTWADNNRMSLNTSKTKSLIIIIIITLQKHSTQTSLVLNGQRGGRYIEQVDHAKLLGVMIDSSMCQKYHINTICSIVSSRLSLLCCIKPYLNFDSALRFYNLCVNNY